MNSHCLSTGFHNPKFLNHKPFKLLNLPLCCSPNPRSHPFQSTKLQFSSKPYKPRKHFTSPPISHIPTSNLSWVTSFFSPQKFFSRILSEKIVLLLVGSFICMGSFKIKPSLALPAQRSSNTMEEERNEHADMWEKVLENDPKNVEALKVILYAKMSRGKTNAALEYVERLIDVEPEEVEWRLLQALCYEMAGQLSKAKRLFKEILKERPLLLRALHGLAMVMHKNHESPAVFEMLNKALKLACSEKRVTEERNIRILIAQMHVVEGELEAGLKKFQDLVDENPRDFRPYLCQGIIYSLLGQNKEAAEQFEMYRSLVPEEFPQRGFLDDVMLMSKSKSREQLNKEFEAEFSNKK